MGVVQDRKKYEKNFRNIEGWGKRSKRPFYRELSYFVQEYVALPSKYKESDWEDSKRAYNEV